MSDRLMRLYHALPPPLWSVAATLRGYQLARWRYGPRSEDMIAEALERDYWPAERLQAWCDERLAALLHRTAERVPWYREHWQARRRRGDTASPAVLAHWPVLDKDMVRANPEAFVADDRPVKGLFKVHTSGTTGTPLRIWRGRAATQEYYALLEARFRRWHDVSWRDGWAILGGQAVVRPNRDRPPYWVWNRAMRQLYLSANHISPRTVGDFVGALARHHVNHLVAYASSATELARQCVAAGLRFGGFRVVVANAEPVLPAQRALVQQAFDAPLRETYGMVETVAGASECPHGTLHEWPELGRIEVLADDSDLPVPDGTAGRLVCTGLINDDMPLIRYLVGDRGSRHATHVACACGRRLPALGRIEGRSNDMLIAPDGRRVYWLNPVFYGLPIVEAQIVQETPSQVRIIHVPAAGFSGQDAQTVTERLRARMGDIEVRLEAVSAIPRGANGKFQSVVNKVRPAGM